MADSAILKEEERYTYRDYKSWDAADGRYELIDGIAYAMSAPSLLHQAAVAELVRQFANYLYGKPCKVYPAPLDVRLFYEDDESDDTVVQPDLSVICDEKKRGKEGCRGAPDLVAEIVSPSNSAMEMQRKFDLYRKAGVREYWVVYPEFKTATVYAFRSAGVDTRFYGSGDTVSVGILPGLAVSLESVFAE